MNTDYDEFGYDTRERRRARTGSDWAGRFGAFIRSRRTDHWIMFLAGLLIGGILF